MKVDKELLEHVAKVARLELTEEEIREFLPQLKEVLKVFSEISEAKDDVPSFQPVEIRDVLRDDVVKDSLTQEDALSNSENTKDGYFKGPKAI